MGDIMSVLSYGIGTVLGFLIIGGLIFLIIHDVTQKKHTVLRNYPVIGRLRFFFEDLGEYFRQYFFAKPPGAGSTKARKTRAESSASARPMTSARRAPSCS